MLSPKLRVGLRWGTGPNPDRVGQALEPLTSWSLISQSKKYLVSVHPASHWAHFSLPLCKSLGVSGPVTSNLPTMC